MGYEGLGKMTYRIMGTLECDDLPALFPKFAQSLNGVRPSRNSNWVNRVRVFHISDCDVRRPRGLLVYRIVKPIL